jgi:SAM-dependent methyltransferase
MRSGRSCRPWGCRLSSSPPEHGSCPVCGRRDLTPVLALAGVPVFCNVAWATREEALAAPRGDISLRFCGHCGMIHNAAFDPQLLRYSPGYENSLHFSPAFREFARALAERLMARYDVLGKRIVDIGCGKGEFLELLCSDATGNRGVGFDPSYAGQAREDGERLTFVRDYYSETHAATPADLICCRHVLEHLEAPRELLSTLAGTSAVVYFEVPDGDYMLREVAGWDVIYEHASYFTASALRYLFEDFGFEALDVGSSFGGQYLYLEAARAGNGRAPREPVGAVTQLGPLVDRFARLYAEKVEAWAGRLAELDAQGRRIAVWGAGSKGVTFLNVVPGAGGIDLVIDVNERKQGRFVPGTGHEIQGHEAVRDHAPDVVLVMNRLYVREIRRTLRRLDVRADVLRV